MQQCPWNSFLHVNRNGRKTDLKAGFNSQKGVWASLVGFEQNVGRLFDASSRNLQFEPFICVLDGLIKHQN